MYKASVETSSFTIEPLAEGIAVDGNTFSWDQVEIGRESFHIIHDNRCYRAVVVAIDKEMKTVTLKVNNSRHVVKLQDRFDILLEKMGMNNANNGRVQSIKAPMPGLIIDLKVKEGDTVQPNDPLIVLEAMKMENIIKSPGAGTVKTVKIKKGESVEKNQILIEF